MYKCVPPRPVWQHLFLPLQKEEGALEIAEGSAVSQNQHATRWMKIWTAANSRFCCRCSEGIQSVMKIQMVVCLHEQHEGTLTLHYHRMSACISLDINRAWLVFRAATEVCGHDGQASNNLHRNMVSESKRLQCLYKAKKERKTKRKINKGRLCWGEFLIFKQLLLR